MERIVYIEPWQEATRRVVVEDGIPVELALDAGDVFDVVGNIFIGRVEKVLTNIGALFVNIGATKNAFLPLSETYESEACRGGAAEKKRVPFAQGQEIIVQVPKGAIGDKGARLSMNATYPGKYCVLLLTSQTVGVSRHIEDPARRQALERIVSSARPDGMGLLIRTAAAEAREEWIAEEANSLREEWNKIAAQSSAQKAPALLFDAGNLHDGAVRDLNAVVLRQPLPSALEEKLRKALRRKIWLPSGAYLVIDRTEAMTVIDVNSGKYATKGAPPETMRKVNGEAAEETARQIRLRDCGGIIIVDLIDMRDETDRDAVLEAFMRAARLDRAKLHVHGFSPAGLLEMTRRSVYRPFMEQPN